MASFMQEITKHLNKLQDVCDSKNPDAKAKNAPHGALMGQWFFWNAIEKFAKGKKDAVDKLLSEDDKFDSDVIRKYDPGEYVLGEAPSFIAKAKVSEPVKRFDGDHLANALNKKYKVPVPIVKQMIDEAKQPSASTVTKTILER